MCSIWYQKGGVDCLSQAVSLLQEHRGPLCCTPLPQHALCVLGGPLHFSSYGEGRSNIKGKLLLMVQDSPGQPLPLTQMSLLTMLQYRASPVQDISPDRAAPPALASTRTHFATGVVF